MEVSQKVIDTAIKLSDASNPHEGLKSILAVLETKTENDLLSDKRDASINEAQRQLYQILSRLSYIHESESEKIKEFATIISTIKPYLLKGIANSNIKDILVFLSVNFYLKIDVKNILTKDQINEINTHSLLEQIFQVLSKHFIRLQAHPDAPYHERKMLEDANEGLVKQSIKAIYKLVSGIELGGRGIYKNFLIEELVLLLSDLNHAQFLKILRNLPSPFSCVFYLQNLEKNKLIKIAQENSLIDKWLNFEIIRKLIEKKEKEVLSVIESEAIKSSLIKINNADFLFLKQTIIYFHRDKLFNSALGELFTVMPVNALEECINDCFVIETDAFSELLESRNALLEGFGKKSSDVQLRLMLQLIYKKWQLFLEDITQSDDSYQGELLLTDCAHFIILYYVTFYSDVQILNDMKNLMVKIKNIDSEWNKSKTNQITSYFLYVSRLYILSFAYKDRKLNFPELAVLFKPLEAEPIQLKRYRLNDNSWYMKNISDNLN